MVNMNTVVCKQCQQVFPAESYGHSTAWEEHDCPEFVNLKLIPGESFEDWKARCAAAKENRDPA